MNKEVKARIFLLAFTGFLAVNLAWSAWITASAGKEAQMARAVTSIALYGSLVFFLWKRSVGVRIFLGIAQLAAPLIFWSAELLGSYRMEESTHYRMAGAVIFGVGLLFWKPMRDYTKKEPNQVPEPTSGLAPGRGSS